MKRIVEDIRNHQFKTVYLIFGNEPYLVLDAKQKLFSAAAGEDQMNSRVLVNQETSVDELRDFTDTVPFFAEKRVLLLDECLSSLNSDPNLVPWIESLPETALVIFAEREVDKRTKFYKSVLKIGTVAELNHLEGKERSDWVLKMLGQRKIRITKNAFDLLIESLPESMEATVFEVGKLCDYVGERREIYPEDVEAIITPKIENRIFKLVDAAVNGRKEETFSLYFDLVALKEAPLRIMALIGKELMRRLTARKMSEEGASFSEIAGTIGIPEFALKRILNQPGKLSVKELAEASERALEYEQAVKSGDLGEAASVELLLYSLTK
ncbi:MAG: DNA polymerase III subunit delta [Lachnospiraceae bacterium]|nr:DNA polymerase III subunit delta [Lachnospiraceae bacterium]